MLKFQCSEPNFGPRPLYRKRESMGLRIEGTYVNKHPLVENNVMCNNVVTIPQSRTVGLYKTLTGLENVGWGASVLAIPSYIRFLQPEECMSTLTTRILVAPGFKKPPTLPTDSVAWSYEVMDDAIGFIDDDIMIWVTNHHSLHKNSKGSFNETLLLCLVPLYMQSIWIGISAEIEVAEIIVKTFVTRELRGLTENLHPSALHYMKPNLPAKCEVYHCYGYWVPLLQPDLRRGRRTWRICTFTHTILQIAFRG